MSGVECDCSADSVSSCTALPATEIFKYACSCKIHKTIHYFKITQMLTARNPIKIWKILNLSKILTFPLKGDIESEFLIK